MRAGVTGHQELGPAPSVRWVSDELRCALNRENVTVGLSCLAKGTDQIYARLLKELGIPLEAIVPCRNIESSFHDPLELKNFQELLMTARYCTTMPFSEPSEQAYFAAGRHLVDRSEMLIAVWDGQPARGLGGTADVVKYARMKNVRVFHLNPATRHSGWMG